MQNITHIDRRQDFVPSTTTNRIRRAGDILSRTDANRLSRASQPFGDAAQDVAIEVGKLLMAQFPRGTDGAEEPSRVFILTDDPVLGAAIGNALTAREPLVEFCQPGGAFFSSDEPQGQSCLVIDARLDLGLLRRIAVASDHAPPIIAIIGYGDVRTAVRAITTGALDCVEMPFEAGLLTSSVRRALARSHELLTHLSVRKAMVGRLLTLTPRERQVMDLILAGHPNKNIAADLCVSQRTVESHRASIMKKTGTRSLPALVRLALAATVGADSWLVPNDRSPQVQKDSVGVEALSAGPAAPWSSRYYPKVAQRSSHDRVGLTITARDVSGASQSHILSA